MPDVEGGSHGTVKVLSLFFLHKIFSWFVHNHFRKKDKIL